ncbi:CopD family protein [Rhodoblastus acidophilus]|uniref:CopD family protein n=1 Tax=Rhodoblastus acidophilus TaxID=1074 RepID=UPI0022259561|nr:CopD family protein [Rhodoblastus acidophilus]
MAFDPAALALPVRWIHFASLFVLLGAALFRLSMPQASPRAARATDALLKAAGPATMVSGLCWLWLLLANMAGGFGAALDPEILLAFFQSPFGPVAALRLLLLVAAGAAIVAPPGARARVLLVVAVALLVDQAWLGHAATGRAGLIAAYCLHVLAAAAWIGGLPPLLFALRQGNGPPDASVTLSRFSAMAMAAVALILVTGLMGVGARVGFSAEALARSDYGLILALKATLFAAMLALAGFNRFVAMPSVREGRMLARLRASVALELVLGVATIGAAAALGATPPP